MDLSYSRVFIEITNTKLINQENTAGKYVRLELHVLKTSLNFDLYLFLRFITNSEKIKHITKICMVIGCISSHVLETSLDLDFCLFVCFITYTKVRNV